MKLIHQMKNKVLSRRISFSRLEVQDIARYFPNVSKDELIFVSMLEVVEIM